MRRWGVVISVVYAVILLGLLFPAAVLLGGEHGLLSAAFYRDVLDGYGEPIAWVPIGMLIFGQAALLFLSVDTSQKRLKPRGPVWRSAVIAGMLFMFISVGLIASVGVAIEGDNAFNWASAAIVLCIFGGLWAMWCVVFYVYLRGKTEITNRVMNWLLKGSVLELLIAVPSHVIVRRRNDCSAPVATSFGITTGIAIMLLSFGPSVLLLYKKRMDALRAPQERHAEVH
jgi:hypothetical protein